MIERNNEDENDNEEYNDGFEIRNFEMIKADNGLQVTFTAREIPLNNENLLSLTSSTSLTSNNNVESNTKKTNTTSSTKNKTNTVSDFENDIYEDEIY